MSVSSRRNLGQQDRNGIDFLVRSALAGGFAGGLAKTAVAPLDRVKILFQTHNPDFKRFSGSWRGTGNALRFIWRTQGLRGLYQGHTLTLTRAIPHAAIGYTVYEEIKQLVMPTPTSQTSYRRFLAGALTGFCSMPFTYPFDLIRVRMAVDTKHSSDYPSPFKAIRTIWREGHRTFPTLNFYRGLSTTILATVPYRGGIFLIWETLNADAKSYLHPATLKKYQTELHLAIGGIAGTTTVMFMYPLGVIRRTQQVSGVDSPDKMLGIRDSVRKVWNAGYGWRGFYSGMGIALVRQVPMQSVSLAAWQIAKQVLDV